MWHLCLYIALLSLPFSVWYLNPKKKTIISIRLYIVSFSYSTLLGHYVTLYILVKMALMDIEVGVAKMEPKGQ